ncbi:MAG: thioredoxin [Candidatus Amesbacteria bacterium]|nr:thioredoxin [Candidatus Amesbacteria bacterium]
MAVINLTKSDFDEKIKSGVTLVDFWATWCGPCRAAAPVIEEMSVEYAGKIVVGKVDVDAEGPLSQKFGVMSIPTIILFKDGVEVGRQVGFAGKQGYLDLLKKCTM